MVGRRSLAAVIAGIAVLGSCTAPASPAPTKVYRVAWLSGTTQVAAAPDLTTFRAGLNALGYVEGQNMSLEIRYADGHTDRDPALAAELVALKPDVIVVRNLPEALAVKQATSTLPVVIAGVPDPVENGLVANLARPGGNFSGAMGAPAALAQRRLQVLKEAFPSISRVAYLYESSNPQQVRQYQEARSVAPELGVDLQPSAVQAPEDLTGAFAAIRSEHADAIIVGGGPLTSSQQTRIVDFFMTTRLPSMTSGTRAYVDGGALMFWSVDESEFLRSASGYVDRILKGANPAELAIEKPSKFLLIINLKTANALGLTIPASVLAQASELIR
jgi:putative ABC transport system substrate-binding protein